jgi:hypothetical protein
MRMNYKVFDVHVKPDSACGRYLNASGCKMQG